MTAIRFPIFLDWKQLVSNSGLTRSFILSTCFAERTGNVELESWLPCVLSKETSEEELSNNPDAQFTSSVVEVSETWATLALVPTLFSASVEYLALHSVFPLLLYVVEKGGANVAQMAPIVTAPARAHNVTSVSGMQFLTVMIAWMDIYPFEMEAW